MSDTITNQTDGAPALGTDEFIINRAGADFKLNHTAIVAGVTALITAEEAARIAADTNLDNTKLNLAGGTMTGLLILSGDPTNVLGAATKQYVDNADALLVPLSGGTMTGFLTLSADPTANLHAATKSYTDTGDAGRWKNATPITCNTNPDYPATAIGNTYRVTAAGRIGGAAGKVVQVDDIIYCHTTDASGGTEASVGSNYIVIQGNLTQADQSTIGYLRISTDAEIVAGTNDETAVTPRGARKIVNELVPNYNRVTTGSTSVVIATTIQSTLYLLTGTTTGAVGVTLPQISSLSGDKQITLKFKDAGINAATNNISISRSGSDTIDGATSKVLSTDGDIVTLVNDGVSKWYIV